MHDIFVRLRGNGGHSAKPPDRGHFHAKQHLFDAARAIYGPGTDLAAAGGKRRRDQLDQGRFDQLLAALGEHADSCDEARKTLDYFNNNRKKMRYPAFRAQGLGCSTGVLEGGCKSVIAARLKNGGMHWTVAGTNAVIALRSAIRLGAPCQNRSLNLATPGSNSESTTAPASHVTTRKAG